MKFLYSLFVIAITASQLIGQNWCGTHQDASFFKRLETNAENMRAGLTESLRSAPKYVPISFIMVADNNGNGRVQEERVLEQVANLNNFYADQELVFYIDELKYLDLSIVYNSPSSPAAGIQMQLNRDNNAINVFITNTADSGSGTAGITLAYYDGNVNRDWLVSRKGQIDLTNATLAHEIGHYFSVAHPHSGWECVPYRESLYGNPVNVNVTMPCPSGAGVGTIEFMNGTNCTTSGDRLCDTPADYNFELSPDYSPGCGYPSGILDKNGDEVQPIVQNIMGYYVCSDYSFTDNQQSIIASDYFSAGRAYIRTGIIPNLSEVTEQVNYIYPEDDGQTDDWTNVKLDWEDVPNANQYLVITARNSNFTQFVERYIVDASELSLTELEQDRFYYWKVWPFNETSTNAGWSATRSFQATDGITAVPVLSQFEKFTISPNPVSSKESLTISALVNEDVHAQIRLIDLNGRIIRQFGEVDFIPNHNHRMNLPLDISESGLYLIQLVSDKGILTRKIMIQN